MEPYQMKNLYASGNFQEIISHWKNKEEREQFTEWDFVYVMNTFYSQKNYETCLEVYRHFHRKFPESDMLDDKMSWSLYHSKIKGFNFKTGDRQQLKKQAEYIIEHSGQKSFSPKWFIIKYLIEHIRNNDFNQILDDSDALRYLDMIEPDSLSTDCETRTTPEGRTVEQASEKENWYTERTKLLLSLNRYEDCIECCDQALNNLFSFHYNNDCWYKYRKAKSLFMLGKGDEAGEIIREIQARGLNHWCIPQLLFEMDRKEGNTENAMIHAAQCALSDPSHEMRVRFYEDFADYLEKTGYRDEALLHRHLVILLRNENNWALREKHLAWDLPDETVSLSKQDTLYRLKNFWNEWNEKNRIWLTGKIVKILPEGKSGFIESEDGKSYYFSAKDIKGKNSPPETGRKVRFTLVDRFDKSKGIVKPTAVQISYI